MFELVTRPVPSFYWAWFAWIHPMLAMTGVLANHFAAADVLRAYSITATIPPRLETSVLLKDLAGYRGGFALIEIFVLRARPTDVNMWRILETCWLMADVSVLGTHLWAVSAEGRLSWETWRAVDMPHIVIAAWLIILRVAFALGVGLNLQKRKAA